MKRTGRNKFGVRGVRRGAALVELAIVLPVLLLLIFGIVEFGQIMFIRHTLINAAKEGAMRATLPGATPEVVTARVRQVLDNGGLTGYDVTVTFTPSTPPGDLAETVRVAIAYGDISLIGGFLDDFELGSTCVMFRGPMGF